MDVSAKFGKPSMKRRLNVAADEPRSGITATRSRSTSSLAGGMPAEHKFNQLGTGFTISASTPTSDTKSPARTVVPSGQQETS